MLDYDEEAAHYDTTRGGEMRASAAADAVDRLLPAPPQLVVDVAGGTGIVSRQLRDRGHRVCVCDRSHGMLQWAEARLPGRVMRSDATTLPVASGSVDAVATVWLLHLLGSASVERVVCEATRVLRPGGLFVTTVDKAAAAGVRRERRASDDRDAVTALALREGLVEAESASFVGHGQGRGSRPDPVYTVVSFLKGARTGDR